MSLLTLFHGSSQVINLPVYGRGRHNNDYGLGFYTTINRELAGEWAVLWTGTDGFINEYLFDSQGLEVLELDSLDVKYWIALLMDNRKGVYDDPLTYRSIELFKRKYLLNVEEYDVINGWRADDAYFSYVEAFALDRLSLENIQKVMRFGNLGTQVCIKSEKAFSAERLKFVKPHKADAGLYYPLAKSRDTDARSEYIKLMKSENAIVGTLLRDLL